LQTARDVCEDLEDIPDDGPDAEALSNNEKTAVCMPLGGRLDMTLSNIGLLEAYPEMRLVTAGQTVRLVGSGRYELPRQDGHYLSLIPWKQANVTIRGVKYPLDRHDVVSHEALTISNEWDDEAADLIVHEGMVLVLYVKK
ncbi:MAG: hypothetical protein F9K39_11190, partial [Exiguobacterium chiriqhucha]